MEKFVLGKDAKGGILSFTSKKKGSKNFQKNLIAKQYFEDVFRKLYKDVYNKRFARKYTREYYELEIFFTNNVFPLLEDGITLEDLESLWKGMNSSDRKLVFNLAYFSDYTNLEEFEVVYFVAKKIFPDKFQHVVGLDRRMIYYVRKKLQSSRKVFVHSIFDKNEYYWLLKLRSVNGERLTKDFLVVAHVFLHGYLYLRKMESQIVSELKDSDVSPEEVMDFIVRSYPDVSLTNSEIKNSIRSFKRYFESNFLPESIQVESEKDFTLPS